MTYVGCLVKVTARSNKGRNRIVEHGEFWRVKKQWGNKLLIETGDDMGNGLRWVDGLDDPDFEIELV